LRRADKGVIFGYCIRRLKLDLCLRSNNLRRVNRMKPIGIFLLSAVLILALNALAQGTKSAAEAQPSQLPPTTASTVDREISGIEKQIVEAAEAMPEAKFNFSPESLNIPGGDYKGVRTFALEVKHVAASNYAILAPLTADKFPEDFMGGDGPAKLKTKTEYVADSGGQQVAPPALGHICRRSRI
jgi:hypothetical protein